MGVQVPPLVSHFFAGLIAAGELLLLPVDLTFRAALVPFCQSFKQFPHGCQGVAAPTQRKRIPHPPASKLFLSATNADGQLAHNDPPAHRSIVATNVTCAGTLDALLANTPCCQSSADTFA